MKKILNILASLLVITAPVGTVVACGPSTPNPSPSHKNFSDDKIADALVEELTNTLKVSIDNLETSKINIQQIETEVQDSLPKTLSIDKVLVENYYSSLVEFTIVGGKDKTFIAGDNVTIQLSYSNVKANKNVLIKLTDKNDDKVVTSLKKLCQTSHDLITNADHKTTIETDLQKNIDNLFKDHSQTKSIYKVISSTNPKDFVDVETDGVFKDGYLNFTVTNINTSHTLGATFTYNFTTPAEKSYQTLNDAFQTPGDLSFSLRNLNMSSFLPSDFTTYFPKPDSIKKLLNNFKIKDLIDDLLNPNGIFAKLMPTDMPVLDGNKIDNNKTGPNEKYWNYIMSISSALLNNFGIDASNGDLVTKDITPSGVSDTTIRMDFYNMIKNIMPDLIHFHNYLFNHQQTSNDVNYFLTFIKYLEDTKQDYPINGSSGKTDNFSKIDIDADSINLHTNFDNLLHDLLNPFTIGKNNSNISGIFITARNHKIHYENIAKKSNPTDSILNVILNTILQNPTGQDVNKSINIVIHITVYFWNFIPITVNVNQNLSLANLHNIELKSLIIDQFHLNGFENDNYQIESGKLFLEGKMNSNNWIELHSIDDVLKCSDLRFQFRDMNFKISNLTDQNIFVEEKNKTLDLTL